MLAPYANRATLGLPKFDQADLNRTIDMLDRDGWQIMVHAIGDGGVHMTLDAFEHAIRVNPPPERPRRHRLEHIETISQADIERFARLGVIASMQPYHANPDSNVFNIWAANLGPERAARAWAWKSIRDAGGQLAFGSDWPVVSIDPRLGMHTALTRQTVDGQPAEGFVPEQRLPLRAVIEAYTFGSARAEYAEDRKGKLAPGMLADVVVWNKDLFAMPPDQVHTAEVALTILGGQIVYQAPRAPSK
jgi:predicted amidohydrolase YtcJ